MSTGRPRWRPSSTASSPPSSASPSSSFTADPPAEFLCPISGTLMADPVVVPPGQTFERACIQACAALAFSPPAVAADLSALPSSSSPLVLVPNVALRTAILNWCDRLALPHPSPLSPDTARDIVRRLMPPHQEQRSQLQHCPPSSVRTRNHYGGDDFEQEQPKQTGGSLEEEIMAVLGAADGAGPAEQEAAMASLRQATRENREMRRQLCTPRLLAALRPMLLSGDAGVQVNAAAAMVNLSLEAENKVRIVRSGAVSPLVDVLRGGHPEARDHAAGAIYSLAPTRRRRRRANGSYLSRNPVSKVVRRITSETSVELKILSEKWRLLLAGVVFQYIHGLAARGVHYLHRPGPTLQDLGFMILPELGKERGYISETLFTFVFLSFVLWTFHPFVLQTKRFYTVLIWRRVLAFLCASQFLRIVTFYSTQLPGPNYHCREGSPLARLPPPQTVAEVLLINFPRGVIYGCGDLIFSSHMIFTLVFVITYHKYGSTRFIKMLAWCIAVVQSFLIIASRKHYSVDVVVAWYTVNLVVFFVDKKLTELPDRSAGSASVLPVSVKDKDSKLKEENSRLLNGNTVDASDRRPRMQMNGKHLENGNHLDTETTKT